MTKARRRTLSARAEFDENVATFAPELRRFVVGKVGPEAADDVMQDIWIAAWQALPTYDGKARLRTWIYSICLHKCHDHYRSSRREERFIALDERYVDSHSFSPEIAAVRSGTVDRLLAEVDPAQRAVLELYYYAQLTLAEIAAILGRNTNTVKYQFYRAHATMLAWGEKEGLR